MARCENIHFFFFPNFCLLNSFFTLLVSLFFVSFSLTQKYSLSLIWNIWSFSHFSFLLILFIFIYFLPFKKLHTSLTACVVCIYQRAHNSSICQQFLISTQIHPSLFLPFQTITVTHYCFFNCVKFQIKVLPLIYVNKDHLRWEQKSSISNYIKMLTSSGSWPNRNSITFLLRFEGLQSLGVWKEFRPFVVYHLLYKY